MPDIDWVEIPPGPFTMGSQEDDDQADKDEKPAHEVNLPAFRISRYPITNAQYQPFLTAGGYDDPQWWTAEGWAWRQGAEADLSAIDNADLRKRYLEWLGQRPADKRDRPFWWDDPPWNALTRPVVGVTWYMVHNKGSHEQQHRQNQRQAANHSRRLRAVTGRP